MHMNVNKLENAIHSRTIMHKVNKGMVQVIWIDADLKDKTEGKEADDSGARSVKIYKH